MYLDNEQLITSLSLGRSVEQWLGVKNHLDFIILKWLRIDREKDGTYSVSYFEVFDDGSLESLDIYDFEPLDPDLPFGVIRNFPGYDLALSHSIDNYHASQDKYVSSGMIQEEYKQYLLRK